MFAVDSEATGIVDRAVRKRRRADRRRVVRRGRGGDRFRDAGNRVRSGTKAMWTRQVPLGRSTASVASGTVDPEMTTSE